MSTRFGTGAPNDTERSARGKAEAMNLKAAARHLGVHYQTAYRLVRSGELIAIKVGAGYEISEAAIDRYLAGRRAIDVAATAELNAAGTRSSGRAVAGTAVDAAASIAEELDALMTITTLTTRPVLEAITRHLGETIGDFAAVRLLSEDRKWLVGAASHHHDPAKRAIIAAMLSQPQPVEARVEQSPIHDGQVHRVDFLRVDAARYLIPPAFQQYADRITVYSLLSVPIICDRRRIVGMITIARDLPGRPFSSADQDVVTEMAARAATAIERVDRFTSGWTARQTLHDRIEALLADHPRVTGQELTDIVVPLFDEHVPEALFDLHRHLVACNAPFAERLGIQPEELTAQNHTFNLTRCFVVEQDQLWSRLVSGETDYLDQLGEGCGTGCPVADGVHWAVARRPDATPAFVIATCSPDPHSSPYSGSGNRLPVCEMRSRALLNLVT